MRRSFRRNLSSPNLSFKRRSQSNSPLRSRTPEPASDLESDFYKPTKLSNLSLSNLSLSSLIPFYKENEIQDGSIDSLARESDVILSKYSIPHLEYKGFSLYVISGLLLGVWTIWCFVPDSILNSMGIYYYPRKWWSVAIPSFLLMLMCYMYVALLFYNIEIKTVPLNNVLTIVDENSVLANDEPNSDTELENLCFKSTSGIWDLPISTINDVLYRNPSLNTN
ncbi:GPI-GlcNAc transferase subunit [Komagataella phaffii CBS 7435]|uniref:PIG-P domain-containing protein n=2 Tax=Komagataella phaffii TaxID=460519 RepID=C4R1B5_KOMPG|nr:Hypothetical protein PAS_chr2-1_0645 [Komagataella phaffii GS115]AOA62455.1 GQ67_00708T0 [Komagataella phaffii]CAH2448184.1 GPI-GlcNAc transferase subunit [Komagataella phaffii CBS 7435]AOA67800.1 GQ68_00681T0 [Komagataella phaffii GS115]CAY69289.1 Hypothetical protein PAS_chr2-1_0645 [Komagataella phaffii GS115]SCV12044.1 GPI-GlcNAc transferase subunit [Komagataella phaffii CBS 7435]